MDFFVDQKIFDYYEYLKNKKNEIDDEYLAELEDLEYEQRNEY